MMLNTLLLSGLADITRKGYWALLDVFRQSKLRQNTGGRSSFRQRRTQRIESPKDPGRFSKA